MDSICKQIGILKIEQITSPKTNEFLYKHTNIQLPAISKDHFSPTSQVNPYSLHSSSNYIDYRTNNCKFSNKCAGTYIRNGVSVEICCTPFVSLFTQNYAITYKTKQSHWCVCTKIVLLYNSSITGFQQSITGLQKPLFSTSICLTLHQPLSISSMNGWPW